jgi:hypothetical protein
VFVGITAQASADERLNSFGQNDLPANFEAAAG